MAVTLESPQHRSGATLWDFTRFLSSIDMNGYRGKYGKTRIVEMDLPKNIQALDLLYELYWEKGEFRDYEDFYAVYLERYESALEAFRKKVDMCNVCFYRGLRARIYRTWASIVTQIHAGYVAREVFGSENVRMSTELDHKGADLQIKYNGSIVNVQIKKETKSREVRIQKSSKSKLPGIQVDLHYFVPNTQILQNPRKRNGEYKKAFKEFYNEYLKKDLLTVLPTGFVVFQPAIFESIKQELF